MKTHIHTKLGAVILSISAGMFAFSCSEDFLDKSPKAELTESSFFQNQQQGTQAINAVYSYPRNFDVHVFSYLGITDIASDDAEKGSVPGDAGFLQDINDFTFDANNGASTGIWTGYFRGDR